MKSAGLIVQSLCAYGVKQIKTEAVVNETFLEKLIRELSEQTERLKRVRQLQRSPDSILQGNGHRYIYRERCRRMQTSTSIGV